MPLVASSWVTQPRAVVIVGALPKRARTRRDPRRRSGLRVLRTTPPLCRIPQAPMRRTGAHGVLPASRDAQVDAARCAQCLSALRHRPGLDFADPGLAMQALGKAQVVRSQQFACASTVRLPT
jgi:hypothetical protein